VSFGRYAGIVLALTAGSLLLVTRVVPSSARSAALLGGALGALNTIAAYFLVRWSQNRSTNAFMVSVLGGMVARLAVLLAAVVLAVLAFGVPKVPLAVSLLAYFVFFLVLELRVVHKSLPGVAAAR
jgi:hypothetical protein